MRLHALLLPFLLALPFASAHADEYAETVKLFRNANPSATLFGTSYGYAVFPTIGKGGAFLGAAHGSGRVYVKGRHVGDTSLTQLSVGPQLGGQAYSQIIFFENKRAFDEFASGSFEFGANASAVAITAAASAEAGTGGAGVGASGTPSHARTASHYHGGTAVFTIAKGGLMAGATLAGQKFSYRAK